MAIIYGLMAMVVVRPCVQATGCLGHLPLMMLFFTHRHGGHRQHQYLAVRSRLVTAQVFFTFPLRVPVSSGQHSRLLVILFVYVRTSCSAGHLHWVWVAAPSEQIHCCVYHYFPIHPPRSLICLAPRTTGIDRVFFTREHYEIESLQSHNRIPGMFVRRLLTCLLYTSPSPRDRTRSRMPSSA